MGGKALVHSGAPRRSNAPEAPPRGCTPRGCTLARLSPPPLRAALLKSRITAVHARQRLVQLQDGLVARAFGAP